MNEAFRKYARLYANNKSELFPLIEKYSGTLLKGKTHGEAIAVYLNLLKTNQQFSDQVEALIVKGGFNNAGGIFGTLVGGVVNFFTANKVSDAQFAEAVLEEQKAKNTQTMIIVGGVTLVSLGLVGLFIYMAVKKK